MVLRPLFGWPREFTAERKASRFESKMSDTVELLDRELRRLDPTDSRYPPSVLQLALREQDFRIDGMPRANSNPSHPGVILSIEPPGRPGMSFPCDTYLHWWDNLRAVALTLEALRKIDRYGVTRTSEQYRGWQAIESGSLDAHGALDYLAKVAGNVSRRADAHSIHRAARAQAHPDRNGGRQSHWDRVEAAATVLKAAGWL